MRSARRAVLESMTFGELKHEITFCRAMIANHDVTNDPALFDCYMRRLVSARAWFMIVGEQLELEVSYRGEQVPAGGDIDVAYEALDGEGLAGGKDVPATPGD